MFVFRAFMTSLSAVNLSQNIVLASLLAEDKLWQIEETQRTKINQERSGTDTVTLQNRQFNARYEISDTGTEGLGKLDVNVSWPKDKRGSYSVDFSTYLVDTN